LTAAEECPVVAQVAVGVLFPFLPTYLYELGVFKADGNKFFKMGATGNGG
jgi:hypothetical protein